MDATLTSGVPRPSPPLPPPAGPNARHAARHRGVTPRPLCARATRHVLYAVALNTLVTGEDGTVAAGQVNAPCRVPEAWCVHGQYAKCQCSLNGTVLDRRILGCWPDGVLEPEILA